MWLGWGLAFMTKGPPGLLPLAGMAVYLGIHDRARLRQMLRPTGWLLFAVVAFTWFGLVIAQEPDRLKYFLGYEVYDRVFTATHHRNRSGTAAFEVYLPMLIVGTQPWSTLALVAAGGPRSAWRRLVTRLRERRRDWLLLMYWLWCHSRYSSCRGRGCSCISSRCSCLCRSCSRGRWPAGPGSTAAT